MSTASSMSGRLVWLLNGLKGQSRGLAVNDWLTTPV